MLADYFQTKTGKNGLSLKLLLGKAVGANLNFIQSESSTRSQLAEQLGFQILFREGNIQAEHLLKQLNQSDQSTVHADSQLGLVTDDASTAILTPPEQAVSSTELCSVRGIWMHAGSR